MDSASFPNALPSSHFLRGPSSLSFVLPGQAFQAIHQVRKEGLTYESDQIRRHLPALRRHCRRKEHDYQKGTLLRMDSSSCGTQEKGSKSVGRNPRHRFAKQENQRTTLPGIYSQAEHVVYRIRPTDEKHPVLLPIGETAQFRISKDKLILRVPELSDKRARVHCRLHDPAPDKDTPTQSASKN